MLPFDHEIGIQLYQDLVKLVVFDMDCSIVPNLAKTNFIQQTSLFCCYFCL
jgi:hypothetical protein